MIAGLVQFVLSNFTLSFLVIGLFCSAISLVRQPKPLQKSGKVDMDALEANITALELQLAQVSEAIEQAGSDLEQVMRLGERYAALQETLESKLQQWERAAHGEESA